MSEPSAREPRGLIDPLRLRDDALRDWVASGSPPLDSFRGGTVGVVAGAPSRVPMGAWRAAAATVGATALPAEEFTEERDPWDLALAAARWCDLLVCSHPEAGFGLAVAVETGTPVLNAGELGGADPLTGIAVWCALGASTRGPQPPRVALGGELRGSRGARGVLEVLAAAHAELLLVPSPGHHPGADVVNRVAERIGRAPLWFDARSMRSLLDVVDTVLLSERVAPQLPLFPAVGLPPDEGDLRARRRVEDADALFVAGADSRSDRLLLDPFRPTGPRVVVLEEALTRTVLARLLVATVTGGVVEEASAPRVQVGSRCRAERCHAARSRRVEPRFRILDAAVGRLRCEHCGTSVIAEVVVSRHEGRIHAPQSSHAARILASNRVYYHSVAEAIQAGCTPSRQATLHRDTD